MPETLESREFSPPPRTFVKPQRAILRIFDLNAWVHSKGFRDYTTFLHSLNDAVVGVKTSDDILPSSCVLATIEMLESLQKMIAEFPPEDMDNQRYGNKSYRLWHAKLEERAEELVKALLPDELKAACVELVPYLLDSFGNATRIDYGSGHEASFLVFLLCLTRLRIFAPPDYRALVTRVFARYLVLCRTLQITYQMEPAGSRGVHAIDDFQFLPFLFGSAQLIGHRRLVPDSYTNRDIVASFAHESLFLDAVNFINKTKTGPFHEHSNQLWNISAVQKWEKVNAGMFKMYEAEVLKKFPVVQHMLFGGLFSFDKRSDAPTESLVREQPSDRSSP